MSKNVRRREVLLAGVALGAAVASGRAFAQTAIAEDNTVAPIIRYYGWEPVAKRVVDPEAHGRGIPAETQIIPFSSSPAERFRPNIVVAGPPLIEPRGMVKGNGYLYIADAGRDESHNEPATIWRLEPYQKKLDVFYRGGLLTNSKWLWFLKGANGRPDELIISNYGDEPKLHDQGTGKDARIFAVEVLADGTAGAVRTIHEGAPLRSPQGVTVAGDHILLADTGAGGAAHRSDAPEVGFTSGAVFSFPLSGGPPTRHFPNHTFVTLVGCCIYYEGKDLYVRLWDIDGGRRDTSPFAWMPHSGFVELTRSRILSVNPSQLAPLERIPLYEEFPITIQLQNLSPNDTLILRGAGSTTFSGGADTLALLSSDVPDGRVSFLAESPTSAETITFSITVVDQNGNVIFQREFEIDKFNASPDGPFRDNKHGGAAVFDSYFLDASVDGLAKTLTLFPPRGGISANVWQGDPLVSPMAAHFSWDGKLIWVTDLGGGPGGTGAVWQFDAPTFADISLMYSPGNARKFTGVLPLA